MVTSSDIINDRSADSARNRLYRVIETNQNVQQFRAKFYSRFLSRSYQQGVSEKEALTHRFNDVQVTLLRPSHSFMFNGLMEMGILEHGENTVILTGEILKRSLSSPTKFFKLSDQNPEGGIDMLFSRLIDAYRNLEKNYPDEHDRREHVTAAMSPIEDVDTLYEQKVSPLIFDSNS